MPFLFHVCFMTWGVTGILFCYPDFCIAKRTQSCPESTSHRKERPIISPSSMNCIVSYNLDSVGIVGFGLCSKRARSGACNVNQKNRAPVSSSMKKFLAPKRLYTKTVVPTQCKEAESEKTQLPRTSDIRYLGHVLNKTTSKRSRYRSTWWNQLGEGHITWLIVQANKPFTCHSIWCPALYTCSFPYATASADSLIWEAYPMRYGLNFKTHNVIYILLPLPLPL